MKKLILCALFIPMGDKHGSNHVHASGTNLVEVRSGEWPINLERDVDERDTSYALLFRDKQVLTSVLMDTLPFANLTQLKYFGKALTVLKTGNNGDIAKFKDYSIKRADKKYEGTWFILRDRWCLTDFQQSEADLLISTIKGL